MRIQQIGIASFQGLREFALTGCKPLLVVAGANGAGKSSLQEAIRFVFQGEPERVGYKKDWHKLLTEGETHGGITIGTDKGELALSLPSGNRHGDFLELHHCALPYLLQPSRIAEQRPEILRDMLNRIGGAELTAETLRAELLARGCDAKRVDGVLPMLRTSVAAVAKAAAEYATQAKGAWRAHTGETYGDKKAAAWKATGPNHGQVQDARAKLAESQKAIGAKEAGLYAAQQAVGAAQARQQAAAARSKRMGELRTVMGLHAQRSDQVNCARKALREAEAARDALPVPDAMLLAGKAPAHAVEMVHPQGCPHCGGLLEVRKGGIVVEHKPQPAAEPSAAPSAAAVAEAKAQRQARMTAESTVSAMQAALDEAETDLKQCDFAGNQLAELEAAESADETPAADAINQKQADDYRAAIEELRKGAAQAEATIASFDAAKVATEKAAAAHADVLAWQAIAEACSPDGIPAQLTAKALGPINDALNDASAVSGWMRVAISEDMEIETYFIGGAIRDYSLLSESEQWRCDAMLAYALARISKLGIVMLDRMDVLDIAGRGQCIAWLADAIAQGEIQTAIVCATLKASPANLPDCAQGVWLDKGVCG